MKKSSIFFCFLSLFLFPSLVSASVVNSNNVEISDIDYTNLRKIYSEAYLDVMTQDKYDELRNLNLDFDTLQTQTLYEITTENYVTGEVTSRYVTKEEYEASKITTSPSRGTIYGTSNKEVYISLIKASSTSAYIIVTAQWWNMPTIRSYDVIGMRFVGMSVVNGSQNGQQIYKLNGASNASTIIYSYNGTNINNQSNGFGISMNLVDSNITFLECTIDAALSISSYPATVYASYQHATSNVSLATSKSYTLGSGGKGNVFIFSSGYGSYYDGMQGVEDTIAS